MSFITLVSDGTINSLTKHYSITQPGLYGIVLDISTPYRFIITQDTSNGSSNYRLGEKLSDTDDILWASGSTKFEIIAQSKYLIIDVFSIKKVPIEIRLVNIS